MACDACERCLIAKTGCPLCMCGVCIALENMNGLDFLYTIACGSYIGKAKTREDAIEIARDVASDEKQAANIWYKGIVVWTANPKR